MLIKNELIKPSDFLTKYYGAIKRKNMHANKKQNDEHKKQSSTITESNHKLIMYS